MRAGHRTLQLVNPPLVEIVASLPRFCPLCAGSRVMRLVWNWRSPQVRTVACWHCTGGLRIRPLPWLTDTPRSTT